MVQITQGQDGLRVEAGAYRLFFPVDRPYAMLDDANGERWAELALPSSLHTREMLDDTARLEAPVAEQFEGGYRITIDSVSSHWQAKALVFTCTDDSVRAHVRVKGRGRLTDCHIFGGYYSGHLRWGSGFFLSGARFQSLFNPEPTGAERRAIPAHESAVQDVMGTSVPGKLHWFFTPPPFCYGVSKAPVEGARAAIGGASVGADQGGTPVAEEAGTSVGPSQTGGGSTAAFGELPAGPWVTFGLACKPGEHNFSGFHYDATEGAFSFRLAYEGQTAIDGEFESPAILIQFGSADPYAGLEQYVQALEGLGLVNLQPRLNRPAWWSEPIQCGWGAQCYVGNATKQRAPAMCTQENYDGFLAALEANGLKPGILVIDDKWSGDYGTCVADPQKWPDLRGWVDTAHANGQKVLLWWKAWDPEGLPAEQCVRNFAGMPVGADPSNPAYEETLRQAIRLMLSKEGYDADGFKVDFSARTPSGPGLVRHGTEWGVELLYKLLWILWDEAKKVKPDALVMCHCPNPYFSNIVDMVRLNDVNTGRPVNPQMIHRARVAMAACPNVLIDTDNWPMPNRATWREYMKIQNDLGIPSLYFATHLDSMEPLEAADYELIRSVWAEHREKLR